MHGSGVTVSCQTLARHNSPAADPSFGRQSGLSCRLNLGDSHRPITGRNNQPDPGLEYGAGLARTGSLPCAKQLEGAASMVRPGTRCRIECPDVSNQCRGVLLPNDPGYLPVEL